MSTRRRGGTPHVGIAAETVELASLDDACEPTLGERGLVQGYLSQDGVATTDGFDVDGCDADVLASYRYTTCSLDGADLYRCAVSEDLDGDPTTNEYSACRWFIIYEGNVVLDPGSDTEPTLYDLRLFLAHGADLHGLFRKYTADGSEDPAISDARIAATQPNAFQATPDASWASVPSLFWDSRSELWRLYFSAEVEGGSAQRYAESADNGLTWGIDGHYAESVDCWDPSVETFDDTACRAVEFELGAEPPDDPTTAREPDVVDGQVIRWPDPDEHVDRVMLLFSGADPRCEPMPRWSSYGAAWHPELGDLSDGSGWRFIPSVVTRPRTRHVPVAGPVGPDVRRPVA